MAVSLAATEQVGERVDRVDVAVHEARGLVPERCCHQVLILI
jgi:hypothetical protein